MVVATKVHCARWCGISCDQFNIFFFNSYEAYKLEELKKERKNITIHS